MSQYYVGNKVEIKRGKNRYIYRERSQGEWDSRIETAELPYKQKNELLHLYSTYRQGAISRKLKFELTLMDFKKLVTNICHYCGAAPSKASGAFPRNGVDRKDSKLGYVLTNCLPCCAICNFGKSTRSYEVFLAYITRVAANRACVAHLKCDNHAVNKETVAEFHKLTGYRHL